MNADWFAAAGAMLAAVAASAACIAAFNQAENARRSADIQTFPLRYAVYEAVVVAYSAFIQSGKLSNDNFNSLARAEREAEFLFSEQARTTLENLRLELIRYVLSQNANTNAPGPGHATLQTCETRYQAAINILTPRLRLSGAPHPVSELLDLAEELFLGSKSP